MEYRWYDDSQSVNDYAKHRRLEKSVGIVPACHVAEPFASYSDLF